MKKWYAFVAAAFAVSALTVCSAIAGEIAAAEWSPNNPLVSIYEGQTDPGVYTIDYNGVETAPISMAEGVRLLMIDGGFVPDPKIIIEYGEPLVPVRLVSEILGAKVDWDEQNRLVTIKYDDKEVRLAIGSDAEIYDSSTYVTLDFFADSFGASVSFIPRLNYGGEWTEGEKEADELIYDESRLYYRNQACVVVIESNKETGKTITVDEGLEAIKLESESMYKSILDLNESQGYEFSDKRQDYDPGAVEYANLNIGRYYVYKLAGFETYPIFLNKYTGEIFSESVGRPFIGWESGFTNISWLYQ